MSNKIVENGLKVSVYLVSAISVYIVFYSAFGFFMANMVVGGAVFGIAPFLIGYFLNKDSNRANLSYRQNFALMFAFQTVGAFIYMYASNLDSVSHPYALSYALLADAVIVYIIYKLGIYFFFKSYIRKIN